MTGRSRSRQLGLGRERHLLGHAGQLPLLLVGRARAGQVLMIKMMPGAVPAASGRARNRWAHRAELGADWQLIGGRS